MDKEKINLLQQALRKLGAAKKLTKLALSDTDSGQFMIHNIEDVMEDIESDITELRNLKENI